MTHRIITVREARVDDALAIATAHVRAWQTAYRSIMPDPFLDALRIEDRVARWRSILAGPLAVPGNWNGVVALDDRVVGFCTAGDSRDDPAMSELWGINVDPDAFGTGAGQALLDATHTELDKRSQPVAMLWVVRENARARRFYERNGWSADGATKTQDFGGQPVTELRYTRSKRG
ncbi:MAG: GNAT family N-acetyltransferase [Myxococcales bacterium]|nr:GNAT family N-acetyltransferase [Myxococcales bacterium]